MLIGRVKFIWTCKYPEYVIASSCWKNIMKIRTITEKLAQSVKWKLSLLFDEVWQFCKQCTSLWKKYYISREKSPILKKKKHCKNYSITTKTICSVRLRTRKRMTTCKNTKVLNYQPLNLIYSPNWCRVPVQLDYSQLCTWRAVHPAPSQSRSHPSRW